MEWIDGAPTCPRLLYSNEQCIFRRLNWDPSVRLWNECSFGSDVFERGYLFWNRVLTLKWGNNCNWKIATFPCRSELQLVRNVIFPQHEFVHLWRQKEIFSPFNMIFFHPLGFKSFAEMPCDFCRYEVENRYDYDGNSRLNSAMQKHNEVDIFSHIWHDEFCWC